MVSGVYWIDTLLSHDDTRTASCLSQRKSDSQIFEFPERKPKQRQKENNKIYNSKFFLEVQQYFGIVFQWTTNNRQDLPQREILK
jgi:hypothetical protein